MGTVYIDKDSQTIQYENNTEWTLIPVETEKEPMTMTLDEVKEFVKECILKLTK